jgi:subtilase family serine protease
VTDTTSNVGIGAVTASTTRFYLSANSTLDSDDVLLTGRHSVPGLPVSGSNTASSSVFIPSETASGSYYIVAKADGDNAISEATETNNALARSIQIGPDLDISSFTVPAKGGAGLALTVSDATTNQGGGSVGTSVTSFYLSANSTFDAGDTFVGTRSVPALSPGEVNSASTTFTVPATVATGQYYFIARADAADAVNETRENNNTYARSIKIGPDFTEGSVTSPSTVNAGATLTVTETVSNGGGGAGPASVTRFYLSVNSTLDAGDVLLSPGRTVPALAPGGTSTGSTVVTVPSSTAPGKYYILAKADGDETVVETSDTNNVQSRSIQIKAAP